MALTGLEQLLIGAGLSLVSATATGSLVWMRTAKEKVNIDDCQQLRDKIETQHRRDCPIDRNVMTRTIHEQECVTKLTPMLADISATKDSIEKLHAKIDRILDKQRESITMSDLQGFIEAAIKR